MTEQWAGNRVRQVALFRTFRAASLREHPVDVIAACETMIANIIADYSKDYQAAVAALDAVAGDIKETIGERFALTASEQVRQ